ncbi:MAG: hypothetical protein Fur0024_2450 [Patescibacteria group bacterium]
MKKLLTIEELIQKARDNKKAAIRAFFRELTEEGGVDFGKRQGDLILFLANLKYLNIYMEAILGIHENQISKMGIEEKKEYTCKCNS